jgi:hypothetical protein
VAHFISSLKVWSEHVLKMERILFVLCIAQNVLVC